MDFFAHEWNAKKRREFDAVLRIGKNTRQNKITCLDKTRQDKTRQDKTRQDKTRQDKTRQDKTRQDKTRQDRATQDKTRQHKTRQTGLSSCASALLASSIA